MGLLDEAIREHLELKRRRGADPSEVDRLEHEALGPVRRTPPDPDAILDEAPPIAGTYPADEDGPYLEEAPEWSDEAEEPAPLNYRPDSSVPDPAAERWAKTEYPTEIAPPPSDEYDAEPDTGAYEAEPPPAAYDPPRHHEIAEEWEAHERQGLPVEPAGFQPDEPAPAPPVPAPPGDPDYASEPPDPPRRVSGSERQRRPAAESYDAEQETVEHDVEGEELRHPDVPEDQEGEDMLEETPDFLQDTPDHDRLWFEQRPPRDFDFDG